MIIQEFPDYTITVRGNIYSIKTGKKMAHGNNGKGYINVYLSKNKKHYSRYVHRLLAIAFIPNPLNLPEVNHKDGNKANIKLSNLEWSTKSSNNLHAYRVLKRNHTIHQFRLTIRLLNRILTLRKEGVSYLRIQKSINNQYSDTHIKKLCTNTNHYLNLLKNENSRIKIIRR